MQVTVIIPCSPPHEYLLPRALISCTAQTVSVDTIVVRDTKRRGPGWARNVALQRVTTEYVVFLDADDELAPTFVERCLVAVQSNGYVYTDWKQGDTVIEAPCRPWTNQTWHVVTTLLRTEDVRRVGGFDETLVGAEDTEFYVKLWTSGVCGKRVREPLFIYHEGGERGRTTRFGPQLKSIQDLISQRYGGIAMAENCNSCGGDTPTPTTPPAGEKQLNDVLAQATWGGNRQERGRVTGRLYPRTGNGKQVWVDARDVDAMPHLFRRVRNEMPPPLPTPQPVVSRKPTMTVLDPDAIELEQPETDMRALAEAMLGPLGKPEPMKHSQPVDPVAARPNVARVRQLAGQVHA